MSAAVQRFFFTPLEALKMRTGMKSLILAGIVCAGGTAQASVSFDWAVVGNAGNAPDPVTGLGSVGNDFRISTTEVTNAQYAQFLNSVDPSGGNRLELFDSVFVGFRARGRAYGIQMIDANPSGSKYEVISGDESRPVEGVSWFSSLRFVNWLESGQSSSADINTGVYEIQDAANPVVNVNRIARSNDAQYFLPNLDEWYKAAYHNASSGTAGDYFLYATGTNIEPFSDDPSDLNTPDNSNVVNHFSNDGMDNGFDDGFAIADGSFTALTNPFTEVGAYSESISPYGTYDQNGNQREWVETSAGFGERWSVGGDAEFGSNAFDSSNFNDDSLRGIVGAANPEGNVGGFRVATVIPEPATVVMLALSGLTMLNRRRRLAA